MCSDQSTGQRDKCWREMEDEEHPKLTAAAASKKKVTNLWRWSWAVNAVVVVFVMIIPPVVFIIGGRIAGERAVWIKTAVDSLRQGSDSAAFLHPRTAHHDRLLGGLLVDGFDQESCHSRYQYAMYRPVAGRQPSEYLLTKLRRQEAMQRRCGPGTAAYSNAVEQLKSGRGVASPECRYLVSITYSGLGNRILSAASAFLYALLTDRVLLVDPSEGMDELFCEPFPDTTWLVPPDFPLAYANFSVYTAESYGNMLKNKVVRNDVAAGDVTAAFQSHQLPAFAYIHLSHDYTDHDKLFFCDEDQRLLRRIPWLVIRTNNYIVPGLFLLTGFQEELGKLFPEPDTVFHHLGRYLFHPNNFIWGLVTRYYQAYLSTAQKRVGIQVRVFGADPYKPELTEQIRACTQGKKLLPEVLAAGEAPLQPASLANSKAVLVASLKSWYYENIKTMYWEHAAAGGGAVSVHQPTHEEYQHFGARSHDAKACAEIYLLSLTDELVTSTMSTFGYVAEGLAGVRAWVLYKPWNRTAEPCGRDVSMEPCFHRPPFYDCKLMQRADSGKIVPQVRTCTDIFWGVKVVGRME